MSRAEIFRALGALCESPAPEHARLADALGIAPPGDPVDEGSTFLFEVHPYASVHLGDEGMLGGEAGARVAGFWRALHLTPPSEPDHLASLLGLYASLIDLEASERDPAFARARREARRALLHEHLTSWVSPFLGAVERVGTPHQIAWAGALRAELAVELTDLGEPDRLPVALRESAPLPEEPAEALRCITAPARTGVVLTRTDVVAAARELGIGVRMGERAFAIRSMVEQDPAGVTAWLAATAQAACRSYGDRPAGSCAPAGVDAWWADRAATTSRTMGGQPREVSIDVAG